MHYTNLLYKYFLDENMYVQFVETKLDYVANYIQ